MIYILKLSLFLEKKSNPNQISLVRVKERQSSMLPAVVLYEEENNRFLEFWSKDVVVYKDLVSNCIQNYLVMHDMVHTKMMLM